VGLLRLLVAWNQCEIWYYDKASKTRVGLLVVTVTKFNSIFQIFNIYSCDHDCRDANIKHYFMFLLKVYLTRRAVLKKTGKNLLLGYVFLES